jgi:hypothetical protein
LMETSEEHRLLHRLLLDFIYTHSASSNGQAITSVCCGIP